MTLTAGLVENLLHYVECSLELSAVLEERQQCRKFLGAEEMLADSSLDAEMKALAEEESSMPAQAYTSIEDIVKLYNTSVNRVKSEAKQLTRN